MNSNISQQELQTFASAAVEVQRISDDYQLKFAESNSPQEQEKIQREATDKMTQAVQDKGMTVEQYNEVARTAQADAEMANQINEYARKML